MKALRFALFGVGTLAFGGFVIFVVFVGALVYSNAAKRPEGTFARDAGNETYTLDGRTVTLTNGVFQEPYDAWLKRPRNPYDREEARAAYLSPEPIASGKVASVRLTDKRVVGDVSSDGMPGETVVLPGEAVVFTFTTGSDSIYYYVTLRRTMGEWHGSTTNSIQLGDRISVEAVRIEGGRLYVDTLERRPGESLMATPSVRITRIFADTGGRLDEVK